MLFVPNRFAPLLVSVSVSVSLLAACGSKDAAPAGPKGRPPALVTVAKAVVRDLPIEVRSPVELRPYAQADVGSKTVGYLDAVLFDRGDEVKAGQVIALVRPSDLPDQLAAARGSLAQAQAAVALARANKERAEVLAPLGRVSQAELEQTRAALAQAEAQESAARAQSSAIATRLGETKIVAPFDGVIVSRKLDPGALVGPTTGSILSLARVDPLRVMVVVNERDVRGLKVGQEARVELDAMGGKPYRGKVVRLSPTLDPVTRTLEAEIRLPNENGELRPGMYGRGYITTDVHANAIVVPVAAVQLSNKKAFVFTVNGDKVKRVPVELGVDGGNWLEIAKGIDPGVELVTAGADGLADGATIRAARNVDVYSGTPVEAGIAPNR